MFSDRDDLTSREGNVSESVREGVTYRDVLRIHMLLNFIHPTTTVMCLSVCPSVCPISVLKDLCCSVKP